MSTERERLIAASMLKQLLGERVEDQVDPVKFWETELDFRLSRAQFGPIREIAQSLVEAIDRLSGGQGESRDRWVEWVAKKRDESEKYGFKPGGVTASSEYIADQAEAAVNRTLRRQQPKL